MAAPDTIFFLLVDPKDEYSFNTYSKMLALTTLFGVAFTAAVMGFVSAGASTELSQAIFLMAAPMLTFFLYAYGAYQMYRARQAAEGDIFQSATRDDKPWAIACGLVILVFMGYMLSLGIPMLITEIAGGSSAEAAASGAEVAAAAIVKGSGSGIDFVNVLIGLSVGLAAALVVVGFAALVATQRDKYESKQTLAAHGKGNIQMEALNPTVKPNPNADPNRGVVAYSKTVRNIIGAEQTQGQGDGLEEQQLHTVDKNRP